MAKRARSRGLSVTACVDKSERRPLYAMAESFSFASARSSQSSFGNAQSNHLNYSESNNNNNTVPNGSLQSPLASLARQASLSLSRQGSSASKAVQSPRQPSENDSSYFAPMLAAQDETLVDARSSTYSNQTDPFHYDVRFSSSPLRALLICFDSVLFPVAKRLSG